eukprot:3699134-Pyramimonas_sp.AAC.1
MARRSRDDLGEASGRACRPPSNLVAELAYGGQLLLYSFSIHGTIWWATDMVEQWGAVGWRGGMYITTHSRNDTCSVTSALAEASYSSPTSLRYYTPEVHPPTPF